MLKRMSNPPHWCPDSMRTHRKARKTYRHNYSVNEHRDADIISVDDDGRARVDYRRFRGRKLELLMTAARAPRSRCFGGTAQTAVLAFRRFRAFAMPSQQPIAKDDDDHRVIPFRPRKVAKALASAPSSKPSLSAKLPARSPVASAPEPDRAPAQPTFGPLGGVRPVRRVLGFLDPADAADFRQRMIINFAALFFVLFLTGAAVWLVATIRDLRRTQACLLAGRPDCPRVLNTPSGPPSPSRQFGDRTGEHL